METTIAILPSALSSISAGFLNPPSTVRPMFRYWWPHGEVQPVEIAREIDQMADAGFGGAEIDDVHHSSEITVPIDPAGHGWGTTPWINGVIAALERAENRGMNIDIAIGPCWPAAVPSITPDSDGAAKELVHGRAVLGNGTAFNGTLPGPFQAAADGVNNQTLYVVQAWRVNNASSSTAKTVILDQNSVIDLTSRAIRGSLNWKPTDQSTWIILAYYVRGSGQQPEAGPHTDPPSYVIDHFSKVGSDSITGYWDKHILNSRFRSLLKSTGRSIFEDSLELDATTFWSLNYPAEFKKRMGYHVASILPVIIRENEKQVFTFADSDMTRGALNDYWTVLGQLYIDYHIGSIEPWANGLGMGLRVQPYGLNTDAMGAAAALTIAEGESLGFKNLDDYRSLAGGVNMALKTIVSNEAAAFANGAYSTTWEKVLRTLNPIFAAGVNQHVLHGFSYLDVPGEPISWPGFAAFTPYNGAIGYAESWGPRQPCWRHAVDVSDYFGRVQYTMRKGTAKHDVAFFRQKGYVGSGFGASYFTSPGVFDGWSLNFVAPSLLELPSAYVRNKRLAPDGPNFGLLAFEGDAFNSQATVLDLETVTKILSYAKAGLPMLIVGNWSNTTAYGYGERSNNGQIEATMSQILKQKNVVNVATRTDMAAGVAALGVQPGVTYSNESQLLYIHRVENDVDHYFFSGSSATVAVDVDVMLPRTNSRAVPYILNPWSGSIHQAPLYNIEKDGRIRIHVTLGPDQTTLITLANPGILSAALIRYATSSTAPSLRRNGNSLMARSTIAGTFSTKLDLGTTLKTTIGTVPATQELTKWTLDVDDWRPGATNTTTEIFKHNLTLNGLQPWTNITELQDVSGVGYYKTTFNLPTWGIGYGATLNFTKFLGSFRISVNGKWIGAIDQLSMVHDLGSNLRKGTNTIEVEVATSLLNRLRVSNPSVYGVATRQAFGLIAPVHIVPYREALVI